MQERLEQSEVGRALISALIIVTLLVVFGANLPRLHDSQLKRVISRIVQPYMSATGIDQSWSVFAPEPPKQNFDFRARVEFSDGSEATWSIPEYDPFIGAFREGRWAKWMEVVRNEVYARDVFSSTAAWIARRYATDERHPVIVEFVRLSQDLPAPGSEATEPAPVNSEAYYTYRVTGDTLDSE